MNGQCLKKFKPHTNLIFGAAKLTRNTFVSCSGDKTIKVWDSNTGKRLKNLIGETDWVISMDLF